MQEVGDVWKASLPQPSNCIANDQADCETGDWSTGHQARLLATDMALSSLHVSSRVCSA